MANNFLDLYFERIQYSQSPKVNLQTLRDLHLLHLQHIPYENIDVFCHQGVKLDRETLTRKILLRHRGGYCFEQNTLLAAALGQLGFHINLLAARVRWGTGVQEATLTNNAAKTVVRSPAGAPITSIWSSLKDKPGYVTSALEARVSENP